MDSAHLLGRLIYAVVACLGALPLGVLRRVGDAGAALALRLDTREVRVARRNIEMISPDLSPSEREARVRGVMHGTARNLLETMRVWTRSRASNLRLVHAVHGEQHYRAAVAQGRGLILVAPHYGNWELLIEFMAARAPFTLIYAVPKRPARDAFLRMARAGDNVHLVHAEANALRPLWKALKDGGTVGITPDQQPKNGGGEFAPFFGKPALTLSLIPRLAERSGAPVLFAWAEPCAEGFEISFEPGLPAISDPDLAVAVAAMNTQVEGIAQRDPTLYQWTYKRYSIPPDAPDDHNPYFPDCY